MPNSQTISQNQVYRDFVLIALAAFGVGLLFSLSLATAIVLANPGRDAAAQTSPVSWAAEPAPTYDTRQALPAAQNES